MMTTSPSEYAAATLPFAPGPTPQDIFTISGSASRVVGVGRIGFTASQSSKGLNAWQLVRRSTLNSGGTSTILTNVALDSAYPASGATVRRYTANPTPGTLVGPVWAEQSIGTDTATAVVDGFERSVEFFVNHPTVLRGVNETIALNFNGAALPPGMQVAVWVQWIEY